MAITATVLTNGGSSTDAASYTTASINVTAGRPIIACVWGRAVDAVAGNYPTVTGANLSFVTVAQQRYHTASSRTLSVYIATPTANSSGALTIAYGGQNQTSGIWSIIEFTNMSMNTSAQVSQSVVDGSYNAATSYTVTLNAFANTNNATLGVFHTENTDLDQQPGSGFTELAELKYDGGGLFVEFKNSNDTTVDTTFSSSRRVGGMAFELKHKTFTPKVIIV